MPIFHQTSLITEPAGTWIRGLLASDGWFTRKNPAGINRYPLGVDVRNFLSAGGITHMIKKKRPPQLPRTAHFPARAILRPQPLELIRAQHRIPHRVLQPLVPEECRPSLEIRP